MSIEAGRKMAHIGHHNLTFACQASDVSAVNVSLESGTRGATRKLGAAKARSLAMAALKSTSETIELCRAKTHSPLPERSVILLGDSGVGKTTLLHALAGRKLRVVHDPRTGRTTLKACREMKGFQIGSTLESQTTFPRMCLCKDVVGKKNFVTFVDFPGLNDNRGVEQEIRNAVSMQKIFESSPKTQALILLDDAALMADRPKALMSLVTSLDEMLPKGIGVLSKSLSLVVTRADATRTVEQVRNNIQRIIKELHLQGSKQRILKSLCKKVAIFRAPTTQSPRVANTLEAVTAIFDNIRTNQYSDKAKIKTPLSILAKNGVSAAFSTLVRSVNTSVRHLIFSCSNFVRKYVQRCSESANDKDLLQEAEENLHGLLETLTIVEREDLHEVHLVVEKCLEVSKTCGETLPTERLNKISQDVRLLSSLRQFVDETSLPKLDVLSYLKSKMEESRSVVIGAQTAIDEMRARVRAARERKKEEDAWNDFLFVKIMEDQEDELLESMMTARMSRAFQNFFDSL